MASVPTIVMTTTVSVTACKHSSSVRKVPPDKGEETGALDWEEGTHLKGLWPLYKLYLLLDALQCNA